MKMTWPMCDVRAIARAALQRAMAISITAALAACGGGGGGTSTAVDPSAPPATTGPATAPLVLTEKNGISATYVATSYGELAVALGELTAQWAGAVQSAGTLTRTRTCGNGGTETLTVDDLDRSGTVTRGDILRVQLQRCYSRWVDSPMSGSVQFQWTSRTDAANYAGLVTFGNDFALVDPDLTLGIAGTLALQRTQANVVTTLQVASYDTAPLAITWQGGGSRIASTPADGHRSILAVPRPQATSAYRDTVQRIDISKRIDLSEARITTRLALQLSSELLGGQLNVGALAPMVAELGAYPLTGTLWITGANNARLVLQTSPNASIDGSVDLTLDLQGDGQAEYGSTLRWPNVLSGALSAPEDPAADEAAATPFTLSWPRGGAAAVLSAPRTRLAHNVVGPLTWQFSAPTELQEGAQLVLSLVAQNGRRNPWRAAETSIPLTLSQQGAFVQLTPTQPLEPGSTYRLMDAHAYAMPSLRIGGGTWQSWDYTLTTDDLVQANVSAAQPGVVSTGLTASLHATHAYTGTSAVALSWRQVSGPPVVLSSTTAADITVSVPATGGNNTGSNGDAELELRAQTPDGDVDFVRIKLPVIGDPLHATQALFSLPAGFDVSSPGSTFLTNHRRDFTQSARVLYNTINGTVMQLTLYSSDDRLVQTYQSGMLMFGMPGGVFSSGTYSTTGPAANLTAFVDSWPSLNNCSPDNGVITVHEIETGPDNEITRLALDFDRSACTGIPAHSGSIRINSDRPLRWQ